MLNRRDLMKTKNIQKLFGVEDIRIVVVEVN